MKENNESLLEIKPLDPKNNSTKQEEDNDFFILYALPSLDDSLIKDGCIECSSAKWGDFKCATLHTQYKDRDSTSTFRNYTVGYEISEKDNVCKNFFLSNGWTENNLNEVIKQNTNNFNEDEVYKKIPYHGYRNKTMSMYLFNPNYKHKDKIQQKNNVKNISVGVMNDKMKNRLSCVETYLEDCNNNKTRNKKTVFDYSNKNQDSSFDNNNYSIEENNEQLMVIPKYSYNNRVAKIPQIIANKNKNTIKLTLNEINFLKEDHVDGKLKLKRICVYKKKLINNNNTDDLQKQNMQIYEIAMHNFPNETIRIIDDDTGQMEFITPQVFKDRYCDNKYLEKINNNVCKDDQCISCNIQ